MIPPLWRKNFDQVLPKVKGPPDWFKKRMEAVRNMPPPTLEEVRRQFEASKRQRDK